MKETELAKPIVSWLNDQNWAVYQEVQFDPSGPVADIVAERQGILWVIETKVALSLAVLEQAAYWGVHYRSVGVPFARNRNYRVAEYYYKVGVIEVSDNGISGYSIDEVIKAPLFIRHHSQAKRYRSGLLELHKTFLPAGSNGGGHLTPYKITMMEVRKIIEINPGCTIKFLYEKLGKMHYSSVQSFKGNLIKALMDFEKDWCRIDTQSKPYQLFIRQ